MDVEMYRADGDQDVFHAARVLRAGHWAYTCRISDQPMPIGYCSVECAHRTPEEAMAHYRRFLVDTAAFTGRWLTKEYRCEVCDEWTPRYAILHSNTSHRLCVLHLNPDGLSRVLFEASAA